MVLTELAAIEMFKMGQEIAKTIRAAIENPDKELRDRFLKETEPLHRFMVMFNTAAAKFFADIIDQPIRPTLPIIPPKP